MTPVVVDASVAVKWFVPEIHAERAAGLLDGRYELLAPDLILPESTNAILKKVGRGELTADEGRQIIAALRDAPVETTPTAALMAPAYEIAGRTGRTVYDALYVALAVARECVFVTADARLAASLAGGPLGSHVRTIDTWDAPPAQST